MDAEEVAKTIPEWATEMVGYPSRFGPFRDCFALVALSSLKSMKSHFSFHRVRVGKVAQFRTEAGAARYAVDWGRRSRVAATNSPAARRCCLCASRTGISSGQSNTVPAALLCGKILWQWLQRSASCRLNAISARTKVGGGALH